MESQTSNIINFPTILTLIRLVLSPLFLPLLLVYLLPLNMVYINSVLCLLFIFFALTDFFDGYLARKYHQETSLGAILDPIADKFLVYSTLIALQVAGKLFFYWVILLIGREFFIMALRQVALERSVNINVSFIAKLKTCAQMAMLAFIIANPYHHLSYLQAPIAHLIESILIALTIFLSLYSAKQYYQSFLLSVVYHDDSTVADDNHEDGNNEWSI